MNARRPRDECPLGDDLLAHFLDGHADAAAAVDALQAHLLSCSTCQNTLAATRRLDALVATGAMTAVDDGRADRLLAGALLRGTEPPAAAAAAPPARTRRGVWIATGFAAALLLVAVLDRRRAPASSDPSAPPPGATLVTERWPADDDTIVLPPRDPNAAPPTDPRAEIARSGLLRRLRRLALQRDLGHDLVAGMLPRAVVLGLPLAGPAGVDACALTLAERLRLEAASALLSSPTQTALRALVTFIASEPPGAGLDRVLRAARSRRSLVARLARELQRRPHDRELVAACARLGHGELDRRLRGAVAGHRELTDCLAAAAAMPGRERQVALLLDLWDDVEARGDDRSGATPERWFATLPAAATAALIDEARSTRHAGRRQHCLLALAVRADAAANPFLLELLRGARHDDSRLAAYALARCASAAPELLRQSARDGRRRFLALAALVSMHDAQTLTMLAELELTYDERAFLAAGDFSLQQLQIAAHLLTQRNATAF